MLNSVMTGALAAVVASCIFFIQSRSIPAVYCSYGILGVTVLAASVQWYFFDRQRARRGYHGLSDMLVQIHSPSTSDSSSRWTWNGLVSFMLSCLSGTVGPEGAASELNYAVAVSTRPRSARWFEQRRRTDVGSVLSAGIAAAFGAPFAGVLIPIELGIGGRTLSSVVCSFTAYLGVKLASDRYDLPRFDLSGVVDGVNLSFSSGWIALATVGVASGLFGIFFLWFIRFSRKGIAGFTPRWASARIAIAGGFLFLVSLIYPLGSISARELLQRLFLTQIPGAESGILFFSKLLALVLVIVGFGTIGIFWPVFALGGFFGFAAHQFVFDGSNFAPMLALAGAASFWAAILGVPITAAVLVLELTGNVGVAAFCLLAALIAHSIARKFSVALPIQDLKEKGIRLVEGRSLEILEAIQVKDIMVTDYETIHEKELLTHLPAKIVSSRYPFMPVVRDRDVYTGLVTIDMVQDLLAESQLGPALGDLFEIKDLLYRSGFKTKVVQSKDRLSATSGLFQDIPCVPVLGEDGRIEGLLFVHHVRLAYDREVARRSLTVDTRVVDVRENGIQ